jgi:hypothetical protein
MLRAAGDAGLEWLTELCNAIWREGKMPLDWRRGVVIPVYKGKGDPLECGSYRPIKLLEHSMKVMERVLERRLRELVHVDEMQRGFMPGRSTVDAVFAVRALVERYLGKGKRLWAAFVDLEKAFDRVPRELVWWALRKQNVTESLIGAVKALYEGSTSAVRVVVGTGTRTGREFDVAVGVHQGSVLSPLLFVVVMDELTRQVRTGVPWELLFADDLGLLAETREELALRLEAWKSALEEGGMKVNTTKTKVIEFGIGLKGKTESGRYPCGVCGKGVGTNSILCTACEKWVHKKCSRVHGALKKAAEEFRCSTCLTGPVPVREANLVAGGSRFTIVDEFCYLGDVIEAGGGVEGTVRARIRSAWARWRALSPVLLQKGFSHRTKGWLYAVGVRSAMLYAAETWPVRAGDVLGLERAQMRMLRWMGGVSRLERRTNESVRASFGLEPIEEVLRRTRLRWFGHVERRGPGELIRVCRDVTVPGRRPAGRPRKTWETLVEEDMQILGLRREEAADRKGWRAAISLRSANPS